MLKKRTLQTHDTSEVEQRKHHQRIAGVPEITGFGHTQRNETICFRGHIHPGDMEIVYIARGELCWWAGNNIYPLSGGEIYITLPDEPHGSNDELCAPCELYWFTVELEPWKGLCGLKPKQAQELQKKLLDIPKRHFPVSGILREIMPKLINMFSSLTKGGKKISPHQARAWLCATLWEIVSCAGNSPASTEISEDISQVLHWLEQNLGGEISLPDMAEYAGLSPSFFKEKFNREIGISPGKYYQRRRVNAAAADIMSGKGSLVSIALDYGFKSSQYLATCLRRETGRSATQLRKISKNQIEKT